MRTMTAVLTILLLATSLATTASAQNPETRVSVLVPHPFEDDARRYATLDRIEGDSIWVQLDGTVSTLAIDRAQPRVRADGNYGTEGLLAGAVLGAVIGGIAGYHSYVPAERRCSPGGRSMLFGEYGPSCSGGYDSGVRAAVAVGGAGYGMLGGIVLGWIAGSMIERWTPLQVDTRTTPEGGMTVRMSR